MLDPLRIDFTDKPRRNLDPVKNVAETAALRQIQRIAGPGKGDICQPPSSSSPFS